MYDKVIGSRSVPRSNSKPRRVCSIDNSIFSLPTSSGEPRAAISPGLRLSNVPVRFFSAVLVPRLQGGQEARWASLCHPGGLENQEGECGLRDRGWWAGDYLGRAWDGVKIMGSSEKKEFRKHEESLKVVWKCLLNICVGLEYKPGKRFWSK